jgi:hypothetical protein
VNPKQLPSKQSGISTVSGNNFISISSFLQKKVLFFNLKLILKSEERRFHLSAKNDYKNFKPMQWFGKRFSFFE